ncbi:hypothetical protein NEOC65_000853 [Neochlamydia sp. AcF65]|nr:hypothetical protein [Neochlamydia sp. AcF65]MBS4171602.1 hypothetical protein [Neochlamydia sp. AcF95]
MLPILRLDELNKIKVLLLCYAERFIGWQAYFYPLCSYEQIF